jgi:alkylhydroperoxidase family enzyme
VTLQALSLQSRTPVLENPHRPTIRVAKEYPRGTGDGNGAREGVKRVMRLPYADVDKSETAQLVKRIIAERGSVISLYRVLIHSPPVAEGWLRYLTAIRTECILPGAIRELVIMRIAGLNGASYEAEQHAPIALREGLSQAQLDALPTWESAAAFNEIQRAVLAYTDAITQRVKVSAKIFEDVEVHFDVRSLVELTATIAAYNMVSRFLEALGIHAERNGNPQNRSNK